MPVQPFGKADPVYDALRVQSNQATWPDAGGGSGSVGGAGIENKIYLWPADASTVSTFDPTEAGLIAALAAAVSGDTVWLPSIPIACTAARTIPAGVALRGISHNAILNFSGFAGACVVLSADSIIDGFTLNHSDGKWFDASADGSKALRIHGTALRAAIGLNVVPEFSEIWIGESAGIYWNDNGGWHKVASNPDANIIRWTGMVNDGSTLYAVTNPAPDTEDLILTKIYKCVNPKAGSPTWTLIAQAGDSAASSTISTYFTYTLGPMVLQSSNLYTLCHLAVATDAWAYGIYDGAAWTWTRTTNHGTFSPLGCGNDMYSFSGASQFIYDGANASLETISAANDIGFEFYRSPLAGTRYCSEKISTTMYLHQIGGSNLATLGAIAALGSLANTKITGPENGNQVYCVSANSGADGHLWLSDNGSTFTDVATWAEGWAKDDDFDGGGKLIWLPISVSNAAVMCRRYTRAGAVDADLTGNFWSVAPAGAKKFKGLSLVYA